ncbi:hypothetical protein OIU84_006289 [Salix udensis]|uniref:Uncharacterized protein n=1 Tax=Salix udensis TaxID=889485 RepID=A0AAD6P282_9ROSI|nr:hypothetical protein OIU84_006289 [Salix udensis]
MSKVYKIRMSVELSLISVKINTELQNSCVRECTIDPVCQESRFTRKNIEEMINIIFINDTNFCRAH